MSIKEKRYEKMKNNPSSVKFKTLQSVLEDFGFLCTPGKGSHKNFRHPKLGTQFVFSVPVHGENPQLKAIYVKNALKAIEEVNS